MFKMPRNILNYSFSTDMDQYILEYGINRKGEINIVCFLIVVHIIDYLYVSQPNAML